MWTFFTQITLMSNMTILAMYSWSSRIWVSMVLIFLYHQIDRAATSLSNMRYANNDKQLLFKDIFWLYLICIFSVHSVYQDYIQRKGVSQCISLCGGIHEYLLYGYWKRHHNFKLCEHHLRLELLGSVKKFKYHFTGTNKV